MARRSNKDPLFDEDENNGFDWQKWGLGAAILFVVGFILYAAFAGRGTLQGPVPVIHADSGEWTKVPENAGGMEIPNQDSTVFDLMDKDAPQPPLEQLETATPPEETGEKAIEEESEEKNKGDIIGDLIAETKKPEKTVEEAKAPVDDSKSEDKAVEVSETPREEAEPVATSELAKVEAKPATGNMVQVRLGSVPGTATSEGVKEFARVKGLAGGKLSGVSASYEPVTLPKGSFVRINVSMDKTAAQSLCDTLSARGAPCLILGQ